MPEIASTWLSVLPRAKGFGQQLSKQTKSEINRSGVANSIASTVGKAGVTAFKALGTVAVGSLAKIVTKGIKFNASMQGFGAAFRTLTREGEDYRDVLRGIENIKLDSALDKRVLAGAAQQLLSVRVSAEDVEDRLRRLGLASMDNAENFKYLTRMYANATSGAGIMQVQMDSLAAKGFNPLMIVADATGRSVESLQREFQGAQGNAQLFQKALELATSEGGKFYTAFTDMAHTFPGAIARMENNWQMFVGRFTGGMTGEAGIMPHLSAFLVQGINPTLYKLGQLAGQSEGLQNLWDWIGGHLVNAGERLYQTVTPLAERFFNWLDHVDFSNMESGLASVKDLLLPVGGMLAGMLGGSLSQIPIVGKLFKGWTGPIGLVIGFFAKMWQKSESLRDAISQAAGTGKQLFGELTPVVERLTDFVGKLAGVAGDMLADVITRLLLPAMETLVPLAVDLLNTILDIITPILECSDAMEAVTSALIGWLVFKKIFGILAPLITKIKTLTTVIKAKGIAAGIAAIKKGALTAVLLANPIAAVIALVAGLVAGLVYFFTQTERGQRIWERFTTAVRHHWEAAVEVLMNLLTTVRDWFIAGFDAVGAAGQWLEDQLSRGFDAIGAAGQWLEDRFRAVVDAIVGFLQRFGDRFQDLADGIGSGITNIVTWFAELPGRVLDAVTSLLQRFGDFMQDVWDRGNQSISDGIDTALEFFRNLPRNILDAIGNLGDLLVDKGRELIGGLISGITSMASNIGGAIRGILPGGNARAVTPHQAIAAHHYDGPLTRSDSGAFQPFSGNPIADAVSATVTRAVGYLNTAAGLWGGITASINTDPNIGDYVTHADLEAHLEQLASFFARDAGQIADGVFDWRERHASTARPSLHGGGW